MNLTSCAGCGTALDKNCLNFIIKYRENGVVDTDYVVWDGEEYVPCVNCPVCGSMVVGNIEDAKYEY